MPIYEYSCKACEAKFEKLLRSMSGDARVECPACGSSKTVRALSVFAVGGEAGAAKKSPASAAAGMCGRCGGPGPCASGY